jgi:hypothetical protein
MPNKIQAKNVEQELKRLIAESTPVEPGLANRLDEMRRWIKDKKPGQLMSKRHVMDFLIELCVDARVWLDLQSLEPATRQTYVDQMAPTEQYWYTDLFPRQIQRALFVSFNPQRDRTVLENRLLQESDRLPASCYTEIEI